MSRLIRGESQGKDVKLNAGKRSVLPTRRFSGSSLTNFLGTSSTPAIASESDRTFERIMRDAFNSDAPADPAALVVDSPWPSAETLRPFIGKWVAVASGAVVYSGETIVQVVGHLKASGLSAESIFQVPVDPNSRD